MKVPTTSFRVTSLASVVPEARRRAIANDQQRENALLVLLSLVLAVAAALN